MDGGREGERMRQRETQRNAPHINTPEPPAATESATAGGKCRPYVTPSCKPALTELVHNRHIDCDTHIGVISVISVISA